MNIELYSWVVSSRRRIAILRDMTRPLTPSQIHKIVNKEHPMSLNNVSDILREMKKEGLVVCLNEDAKMGRLYQLTKWGGEIRKEISEANY